MSSNPTQPSTSLSSSTGSQSSAAGQVPKPQSIHANSIYLTFNPPAEDERHRGLFITNPLNPSGELREVPVNGTLFYSVYNRGDGCSFKKTIVSNIHNDITPIFLYHIGTLASDPPEFHIQLQMVEQILSTLKSKPKPTKASGNKDLGGYIRVARYLLFEDALKTLLHEIPPGIFCPFFVRYWNILPKVVLEEARAMAGPPHGAMVGMLNPKEVTVFNRLNIGSEET